MELTSQVEQALRQLYHSEDGGQRISAQRWLLLVQHSREAWEMVWSLLDKTKAVEVQFFGASTLAVKIHRYWNELAPEDFDGLRHRIFKFLIESAGNTALRLVLGKLCVALAILLLNATPDQWPAAVASAVLTFNQSIHTNGNVRFALLEFLTVLPEEFHAHMHLAGSKKVAVRRELENGIPTVLCVIETNLQDQSLPPSVQQGCLRCLKAWIQFGVPLAKVERFLPHLYKCLGDSNLGEIAIECLVEMASHPDSSRYPLSVRKLISLTVQLAPELGRMKQELDLDGCYSIGRVVVALVEAHVSLLLSTNSESEQQEALSLMQLMLELTAMTGYPVDEACSEMTFNAWYLFIDEITVQRREISHKQIMVFGDLLLSLLQVLYKKVQLPPKSVEENWTNEDKEQMRCYREDVGDTMLYLHGLMGIVAMQELHKMFERQLLERDSTPWQAMEATLYLLRSIAENTTDEEDVYISSIISRLNELPPYTQLTYRSLLVVGAYSEWLASHPELLQCVLPLLLSGLSDPELAPAAAIALRDVGEVCGEQLTGLLDQLVPICQDAICSNALELRECVRVLEMVTFVLSPLSVQALLPHLEALFAPRAAELKRLAEMEPELSSKHLVHREIRLLSAVCRILDPTLQDAEQHPTVSLLLQVSEPLQTVMNRWQWDTEAIDFFCGCLSGAIRVTQAHFAPLVDWTVTNLVQLFSVTHNPLLVDIGAQLVGMFGKEEARFPSIPVLVTQMVGMCFSLFEISLHDHTDVVQKLMNFLTWVGRSSSLLFNDLERASRIFCCSVAALSLPELNTVKATCLFLCDFIRYCSEKEEALHVVSQNASDLLSCVFKAIGGGVPRQMLESMADVLLAMNKHCTELLATGLMMMVRQDGFPSVAVSMAQKETFAKSVLLERAHKKRLQEVVQSFYLLCRGLV